MKNNSLVNVLRLTDVITEILDKHNLSLFIVLYMVVCFVYFCLIVIFMYY